MELGQEVTLHLVPVEFWHRHHRPPVGHKFSLGCADEDGVLRGVCMVGRPVARHLDDGLTLEVNRTTTDGTKNANSMLYGAAWRVTAGLGYQRLITYTQAHESGASLRGAGWRVVHELPERHGWTTPSRPRSDRGVDRMPRTLWEVS